MNICLIFFWSGIMFIEVSKNLIDLSKFFPENLYVVGGYVRNKLLKISSGDVDLASSVDIEEVSKRLEGSEFSVKVKNIRTGSLLIKKDDESYEYTFFRKDVYGNDGSHVPERVERTEDIFEDSKRRDFSVNAIYYNINKDEIVDFYHGIIDLKQKVLRCTFAPEQVLKSDGERILRMVRIAGELDFSIDKNTFKTAIEFASNVGDISGSRRFAELEKILYCDRRYSIGKSSLKRALKLLNELKIWKVMSLKNEAVKYDMVYKVEDRLLGLLIDIVDTEKPECLQAFLEVFLKEQLGLASTLSKKIFDYLAGYYNALAGMANKEYFFKYYEDWAAVYSLLKCKSKRVLGKYNFFYKYIIEHGLTIQVANLKISENDIKANFKNIDKRNYSKILNNLLSKVFDGKVQNEKASLLAEIEKNLQNY